MKKLSLKLNLLLFFFSLSICSFGQGKVNTLEANYYLPPGSSITSLNGEYELKYQSDGNLVVYDKNRKAIWASNSNNTGKAGKATMQSDGNFVVYNAEGKVVWTSDTKNSGSNTVVELQNNGEFYVVKKGTIDEVIYSSKDAGWGWQHKNETITNAKSDWAMDSGWARLSGLVDVNGKSIPELKKMYSKGDSYCDDCIAVEIGYQYNLSGDYENGIKWLEKGRGNALGNYFMAIMNYKGEGTPINYTKALSLYKELADRFDGTNHIFGYGKNLSNVQNRIAAFYYFGKGVDKDISTAKSWVKKAAENGSQAGNENLEKYFSH